MTDQPAAQQGLPVNGYQLQTTDNISLVNEGKQIEELVLRWIDKVMAYAQADPRAHDPRFVAIGRTEIQMGFMAVNRGVFNPSRIGGHLVLADEQGAYEFRDAALDALNEPKVR